MSYVGINSAIKVYHRSYKVRKLDLRSVLTNWDLYNVRSNTSEKWLGCRDFNKVAVGGMYMCMWAWKCVLVYVFVRGKVWLCGNMTCLYGNVWVCEYVHGVSVCSWMYVCVRACMCIWKGYLRARESDKRGYKQQPKMITIKRNCSRLTYFSRNFHSIESNSFAGMSGYSGRFQPFISLCLRKLRLINVLKAVAHVYLGSGTNLRSWRMRLWNKM